MKNMIGELPGTENLVRVVSMASDDHVIRH